MNLDGFEKARNSLDLSKVNIGKANRTAICSAISELLEMGDVTGIKWHDHFWTVEA
jgi:hypothetical protein